MGKYENKNKKKKRGSRKGLLIGIIIVLLALIAVLAMGLLPSKENPVAAKQTTAGQNATIQDTETIQTAPANGNFGNLQELNARIDGGMQIMDVGSYTGLYMEDGSDEIVSGVMMMSVTNVSEDTIQLARIEMAVGDQTAQFELTTLPPGKSVVLLEKNRMPYNSKFNYSTAAVTVNDVAVLSDALSLHEDKLKIQPLEGVINLTNVSGADITDRIELYYKNASADMYYGGITYRLVLEDGLKAGEIRQLRAAHFRESGSEVMFVMLIP